MNILLSNMQCNDNCPAVWNEWLAYVCVYIYILNLSNVLVNRSWGVSEDKNNGVKIPHLNLQIVVNYILQTESHITLSTI